MGDETLAQARRHNEQAIRRLLQCQREDRWPTGYEKTRVLEIV